MRYKITHILILTSSLVSAKDYGTYGHTYPIIEKCLAEQIQEEMSNSSEEEINANLNKIRQGFIKVIENPEPVRGIDEATENRIRYMDPSIVLQEDIKDEKGSVLFKKGSKINPLEIKNLNQKIVVFSGSNLKHIEWARNYPESIWVLVEGQPIKLEKEESRIVYFDQGGTLKKKFQITKIPTIISQEGSMLKIEEVAIEN